MQNTDLRFVVGWHLNNAPKDMSIADNNIGGATYGGLLTGSTSPNGETNADVEGILSVSSPVGITYQNAGYTANDFYSPDIDSTTTSKTGVVLPLSGTDVICGSYGFSYKTRLTLLGTFGGQVTGKMLVDGDYSALLGATPTNLKLQIYGSTTGHNGTYDIVSVTFNTPNTEIIVTGATDFTVHADDKIGIIFETFKLYTYCASAVTGSIDLSSSCVFSQLTSEDTSTYDMVISGTTYTPTVSRAWSIQTPSTYSTTPVTGVSNPFIIGYGTSVKSGANLWTGNYNVTLTSTLTYVLDVWGGVNWQILYDEVSINDTITVVCDTCFCNLFQCIKNLFDKYNVMLGTNPTGANLLYSKIIQVLENWVLFQLAERCGEDTRAFCGAITTIIVSENCQCPSSTSIVSEEIIPLSLQTVPSAGSQHFTSGSYTDGFPTSPSLGDHHLFTDAGSVSGQAVALGDIWQYTSGGWVFVMNIEGATGSAGSTGAAGTNGINGASMVFNNTPLAPPTTTSLSYVAFTGMTTSALTSLVANGDRLVIDTMFSSVLQGVGSRVKVQIDGTDIPLPALFGGTFEFGFSGADTNTRIQIVVDVQDFATKKIRVTIKAYGSYAGGLFNNNNYAEAYCTMTTSSALNNIVVRAMGLSGDGTDVVSCEQLAITYFKK